MLCVTLILLLIGCIIIQQYASGDPTLDSIIDNSCKNNCSSNGYCMPNGTACLCNEKYTGQYCEKMIEECPEGIATCSANEICAPDLNSYKCVCAPGLTGKDCEIRISCRCSENGVCTDLNSYKCVCAPGYTGKDCEIRISCLNLGCSGNGVCTEVNDTKIVICECDEGYEGDLCDAIAIATTDEHNDTIVTALGLSANSKLIVWAVTGNIVTLLVILILITGSIALLKIRKSRRKKNLQDKVTYDAFHDQYQSSHPLHSSTDEIITPQDAHMLEAGEVLENFQRSTSDCILTSPLPSETQHIEKDSIVPRDPPSLASVSYPEIDTIEEKLENIIHTKFIEHDTLTFDSRGGEHFIDSYGIVIPSGAIPEGKVVTINIGITVCTQLMSLLPPDLKAVSSIMELCVVEEPNFKFCKPIEVQMPHFLDVESVEDLDYLNLHFLKSGHNLACFHATDGIEEFNRDTHCGILSIDHFCSFCIAANKSGIDACQIYYHIIRVMPRQITQPKWDIIFCINLYTCSRIVEKQFSLVEYEIRKVKLFKFNRMFSDEPYMELHFERELKGGWNLTLQLGPKIKASDVDYTLMEPVILESMEMDLLYPPRYTVNVSGTSANSAAVLHLNFTGSMDHFSTEVLLEPVNKLEFKQNPTTQDSSSGHKIGGTQSLPNCSTEWQDQVFLPGFKEDLDKLELAPTHLELMSRIAVCAPTKWRNLGLQLGLAPADLDVFEARHAGDCHRCYSCIFSAWENQLTRPFTWETIIQALRAPLLGEYRLAEETRASLLQVSQFPWNSTARTSGSSGFGSVASRDATLLDSSEDQAI